MSNEFIEVVRNSNNEIEEVKHLAEPEYRAVFFTITAVALLVGFCILRIS